MVRAQNLNLALASELADASSQAYHAATIESSLCHVLIIEKDNYRIIAFRGTEDMGDWITDAKFLQHRVGPERIHAGFLDAWLSIAAELRDALITSAKPFYITGHSLGGAMAMLAAKLLSEVIKLQLRSVYTFGQPRVGDAAFARAYDREFYWQTFRFVNDADIVPRIPWLFGKYRHAGQEVFLPETAPGYMLEPNLWNKLTSDAIGMYHAWRARRAMAIGELLQDHFISSYITRMDSLRPTPTPLV